MKIRVIRGKNKALLFLFLPGLLICGDLLPSPETVDQTIAELEDNAQTDQIIHNFSTRIRLHPDRDQGKWQYQSRLGREAFQSAVRIDRNPVTGELSTTRLYFSYNRRQFQLHAGDIKVLLGQGLLFGNAFGRSLGGSGFLSAVKNQSRVGKNMSSESLPGIRGVVLELSTTQTSHRIIYGQCPTDFPEVLLNFQAVDHHRFLAYQLVSGSALNPLGITVSLQEFTLENNPKRVYEPALSVFMDFEFGGIKFAGESALRKNGSAWNANFSANYPDLKWLVHYHYYAPFWSAVFGLPASGFAGGVNESGWLFQIQTKSRFFTLRTYLGLYSKIKPDPGEPADIRSEFSVTLESPELIFGIIEVQYKLRERFDQENLLINGLSHDRWLQVNRESAALRYKRSKKSGSGSISVKLIRLDNDLAKSAEGYLLSVDFPKIQYNDFRFRYGMHQFKTDGWAARIYDYESSLPGEFRILPFYENGFEAYLTCQYALSSFSVLSFRYAVQWQNTAHTERQSAYALQFDIHK